jgi:tetratricopeptide (TPR) repeat protein
VDLDNLGALFFDQGDYKFAQQHHERALTINEKVLGPNHPGTARSLNNLATVLVVVGNFAEARLNFDRALTIYERALGREHPSTKAVAGNTASLLDELKLPEEAAAIREKFGLG